MWKEIKKRLLRGEGIILYLTLLRFSLAITREIYLTWRDGYTSFQKTEIISQAISTDHGRRVLAAALVAGVKINGR